MDSKELVFKQEIKEEDEVFFELIEDQSYSLESVKEESVLNKIEQVESCVHLIDNKSYFVVDGIKEEVLDDIQINNNMEFKEEEINCEWSECTLNERDPLDLSEMQDTSLLPHYESAQSSSSANTNGHLHMVTVGNRIIWQSSWVNDVYAVMEGTSNEYFTMQGFGVPVSASGQGEKAGSQASTSNDCSSLVVGNLATGEYTVTSSNYSNLCNQGLDSFSNICGESNSEKNRGSLSAKTSRTEDSKLKSIKRTTALSSEQLEERKKKRRLYMKNYRAKQSKEAREARLQHARQHAAESRASESEQTRESRLQQVRQHAAQTRASESEQAKEARLQQMRQHAAQTRASE